AETRRKFDEIVDFAGVRDFIDIPVKRYSSGMQVRLAFAVAAHLDPEVLLLDEVLAVGDAEFQARSHARVEEMARGGRTVLFVSHDVSSVARLCDNAIVLKGGRVVYSGTAEDAVADYLGGMAPTIGDSGRHRDLASPVHIGRVEARGIESGGHLRTGAPAEITVALEASQSIPLRDLRVEIAIYHPTVGQCAAFSTDLDGHEAIRDETIAPGTSLVCTTESLPFKQGFYVIGVALYLHGKLVDQIDRAFDLVLAPSPFFSSGGVPPTYPAVTVLRHRWEIEPSDSERDAGASRRASAVSRTSH